MTFHAQYTTCPPLSKDVSPEMNDFYLLNNDKPFPDIPLCADNPDFIEEDEGKRMPTRDDVARHTRCVRICQGCPMLDLCEERLQAYEKAGIPIYGIVAGRYWMDKSPGRGSRDKHTFLGRFVNVKIHHHPKRDDQQTMPGSNVDRHDNR